MSNDTSRPMRSHLSEKINVVLRDAASAGEQEDVSSLLDALLNDAVNARASDAHIEPHGDGFRIRLRIDGVVLDTAVLSKDQGMQLINQSRVMAGLDPVSTALPQEGRLTHDVNGQEREVRLTSVTCVNGERLALRILDPRGVGQRMRDLGLGQGMVDQIEDWLGDIEGMFLITGPTGSGKTTSLYALLHELSMVEQTVITIEDPVEYQVDGISQIQVDDDHGLSFAEGIKSMLRMDPDYLLLGEIRDAESARAAIDAAASGRVLLSTLHSRDAVGALRTLRNWGIEDHEIAATLRVVVAQRLVRRLCSECRRQTAPSDRDRRWFDSLRLDAPEAVWRASGCPTCNQLGYVGRIGLFEVWRIDDAVHELILDQRDERTIRRHLAHAGYAFLLEDALAKARDGTTTIEELRNAGGLRPYGVPAKNTET